MKRVTNILFGFLSLILVISARAQKKPIDLNSLDKWEWFTERRISYDGKWVSFSTAPANSRQTLLRLKNMRGHEVYTFASAYNGRFSTDSRFFTCQLPPTKPELPDTTVVVQLSNGQVQKMPGISSFNWADSISDIRSWIKGAKADQVLTVSNVKGEELLVQTHVQQHLLLPNGSGVFYSIKDSNGVQLLYANLQQRTFDTLMKNQSAIGYFSLDAFSKRLAIPVTEGQITTLMLYDYRNQKLSRLPITSKRGDTGYIVTPTTKVQFLKEQGSILYSTQYVSPVRAGTPLVGEARVEVWSTTDKQLYTKQKRELPSELNKAYYFSYDLASGKSIPLTSIDADEWQSPEMSRVEYVLVSTSLPYQSQMQWDPVVRRDAYIVNIKTGERKLVARNTAAEFKLSPYGQFVVWYDRDLRHYYTYAIKNGAVRQIDKGISNQLANQTVDMPQAPEPFGIALWEEQDRSLLITTDRDVWKADPLGQSSAQNITAATAKSKGLRFSYYGHLRQTSYYTSADTLLFTAIADKTKENGFFAVMPGARQTPRMLLFGMYSFTFPGMDIARDGRQALLSFGNNEYYGLFYTEDLKHFDTLYILNPQQKNYNWYKTELVRWQVRKGVNTEGVLYKPEDFDPNKKYPLLIWMYENGHVNNCNDYVLPQWSGSYINFAFYASNGYVVFVPDIRYQIGRPGSSAFETVMTGVDYLKKQGWLDTLHMGLQSHSWGGYEIAYMLTCTNRFKAASAGAVVANMTSAYGSIRTNYNGESRQWVYEKHQSRLGASLWQKPELYIENSPLFKADKITTPLLLMHNEQDGGVPFSQGLEFFSALKRLNKKAWLLNYPEENHVLRNPVNKKDFTYRLFQFFEHYLKDKPAPEWMIQGIPAINEGFTKGY